MELRKASTMDWVRVFNAVCRKHIDYITPEQTFDDFKAERLYVVAEGSKVYATVSLVEEPDYGYTAIKRLCILNKRNCGKGLARFALRELQKVVVGKKIGATPWVDNIAMRNLLESEGFAVQYVFREVWCFYMKEVRV